MTSQDFMWMAIGLAALAVAAGIVAVCVRLARVLGRTDEALVKLERQLDGMSVPVAATLDHVNGVAASIDALVARVSRIADIVEKAAEAVAKTADAAQAAVTPAVANLIGVVAGVSQGARTFFRSRGRNGSQSRD